MMDRNYPPAPAFPDPPASDASPQPATAWAYDRDPGSLKPSLSYGGVHPSETDLHRQTYTVSHQLPAYATTSNAAGSSGIFDNTMHSTNSNTKETSVMNFLTAIESRNAQVVSSGTTLLPQFRAPTWQPGLHSSTELFVTGALPASGTFPPTSSFQHPTVFSNRSFATTPLTLQDTTFSTVSNGLLTAHDPLVQIKTPQGTVPTALTFERLGSSVLSTSIPPQSSTYRSAQESAPHLLQPQFSLLPSSLAGAQPSPQVYSSSLFTGSTASIERALQRECSVIKHHQRPSSTQSVQTQLTGSQHSLHNYLSSASGPDFQDTSQQSSLSCSPVADITQVSNGGPQQKTSQVSVELAQSYTPAITSFSFTSVSNSKAKHCSTKQPSRSTKTSKAQSIASSVQTQSYSKTVQSQNSVIAGQAQIYSIAQLPSLLSVSQSQNYVSTQSQNVPSVSPTQVFSAVKVEKLPSLYKTLAFSGETQAITSDSQTLSYSSDQQALSSVSNDNYSGQTRDLPSNSQSQNYSSSHSQGLSTVSQSQVSYSSQSQVLASISPSETYTTGQSLTLTSPSLPFSSHVQNISTSSPTTNYISLHSQAQESSSPQSQKFLPVVQSTFAIPGHAQALQNNQSSLDTKSYGKRKSDPNLYQTSKQDDQFSMQDLQPLQPQTSLDSTTHRLTNSEVHAQDGMYKVSKADNRYSQSVIRSNSRLEDQVVGHTFQETKKDERMVSSAAQLSQQIGHITNAVSHEIKKAANLMQPTQVNEDDKELSQPHTLLHNMHETKVSEQQGQVTSSPSQLHTQAIRHGPQLCLPGAQILLESPCDLHMLQQSILQSTLGNAKASPQVQQIQSPQQVTHQFLQVDGHMIQNNGGHSQQQLHPQNSEVMKMDISEPSKSLQQHLTSKDDFVQPNHESKNQYVSLGSVCFPESMLLGDDRNILSNVDDILAATAAACGVTPSEFAKSTSNEEEIQAAENRDNSKSQFETIDVRHASPSFSSSPTVVGKPMGINSISLNGGQITLNLTTVSAEHPNNMNLDEQQIETSDQSIPLRVATSELEQRPEQASSVFIKQESSISTECEGKNNVQMDGSVGLKDVNLFLGGRTLNEGSATSGSNFNMDSDSSVTESKTTVSLQPLSTLQPHDENGIKTEEENQALLQKDCRKKKEKDQNQIKNSSEDDTNQKQLKRGGQCKRQNSRGTDVTLPYSSPVPESFDIYQHQEKMRQKIKEVEEKQPEVRTGFIASFLDFLKSGPKQQFSAPAVRVPNRVRRPVAPVIRTPCHPPLSKPQVAVTPAHLQVNVDIGDKKDNESKRNSEALPAFSSDEDSVGGNQDLQKRITSALSTSDNASSKKKKSEPEKTVSKATINTVTKKDPSHITASANPQVKTCSVQPEKDNVATDQLAKIQTTAAIEGHIEDENGDSGGEGIYRERDEFVVKIEDIESLKAALKAGKEPPAIWKVQKALLQKFVPEVRNGQREFAATNSYLGYFGDAKSKYKRIYVKLIDSANKRECVRVCSKRPINKPLQPTRPAHSKPCINKLSTTINKPTVNKPSVNKVPDPPAPKASTVATKVSSVKPKAKQPKIKAEPPPKKRKTWKEEFPSSPQPKTDEDSGPPAPFVARFLNTRAMKETFRNYMELLVGIALDPDTILTLEKSNDELLLPHMRKIDGMLDDNRKRLLSKLRLERSFKAALESFPELTIIARDSKTKTGVSPVSRIKMNGKAYNKKTLKLSKATTKLAQEFAVDPEKIPLCSLYHSLHHYKYHMFLRCKVEISSVQKKNANLGQEEIVRKCMKNVKWVEDLFEKFGELLNQVQQKCS